MEPRKPINKLIQVSGVGNLLKYTRPRLVVDLEERLSLPVFLYPSGTLFDIHLNLLRVTAAAYCLYKPPLPARFVYDAD